MIPRRPTVVVAPHGVANFPEGGGHFWVYLQYVLGLRQLGCDVYWLEGYATNGHADRDVAALATLRARAEPWGLSDRLIVYLTRGDPSRDPPSEYVIGSRRVAEAVYARADLLLNFHYATSPALLAQFRRTALLDIDPGLLQFWIRRGQIAVPEHDLYYTIGERVGGEGETGTPAGLPWRQSRPAICLEGWSYTFDPRCEAFTTISTWDSSDWVVDAEETYENTKRVAFLEYRDLPRLTDQPLELALALGTERDLAERRDLERRGWRVRQARDVAATPEMYRSYIRSSRGEFSCAKRSCVKFQNGWVSDRTLCYLASGKPVVVQDTGPSSTLPSAEGSWRFSTPEGAAEAFARINADYERQCRAARALAESYFDARQVIGAILDEAIG